jgi:hypothetical protein
MRTIIKHNYISTGPGRRWRQEARGAARAHVKYLQFRPGKDPDSDPHRSFFSKEEEAINYREIFHHIDAQKKPYALIHRIVLSPGVEGVDMQAYTKEVMYDLSRSLGRELVWWAIEHDNTAHRHAHIVVLGTDAVGRPVHFRRRDYDAGRRSGDEYLEREPAGQKAQEKNTERLFQKLARITRQALYAIAGRRDEGQARLDYRTRLQLLEAESLGSGCEPSEAAMKRLKRIERLEEKLDDQWQQYSRPIEIKYTHPKLQEKAIYTWRSPLSALRELELEYLAGDLFVCQSMNRQDYDRLVQWIKHGHFERKKLASAAADIVAIEFDYAEAPSRRFDAGSALSELKEVQQMHAAGIIHLQEEEQMAVGNWITTARSRSKSGQKISPTEDKFGLNPNNRKEVLELFLRAKIHGQQWASIDLSNEDYRELILNVEPNRSFDRITKYKGTRTQRPRSKDRSPDR